MWAEEFGNSSQHIDIWPSSNEWATEHVTDAMREAIAEQAKATARIAQRIKNSKAQHQAYAQFLNFLLWELSDELLTILRKLFFTTTDTKTNISYTRKKTNYPVMIGLFVPFFRNKIIEYKMRPLYEDIYNPTITLTPRSYINYLKILAQSMHDNVALNQHTLLQCIMLIIKEFNLVDPKSLEEAKIKEIKTLIKEELF